MKRACVLAFAMACGGGGSDAPDPDTVMPLSWEAGDLTAMVVVERQFVDPVTLGADRCGWYLQLGEATSAGELPRSDQEGACIVTESELELRTSPGFEAFCGGTVQVVAGGLNQTLTLCGIDRIPDRMDLDCADADAAETIMVSSMSDEASDDRLAEVMASVETGRIPDIQSPVVNEGGTTVWPTGEFLVGWGGMGGESVEIVLRERMATGPAIRCFVEDVNSFVIPDRLLESFRGMIVSLEVARVNQTVVDVEGTELRISHRVSDATWVFPES